MTAAEAETKQELLDEPDMDDVEKYAPLIPIFGAVESVFDAWEQAIRMLELETEPAEWKRVPNRRMKRDAIYSRGIIQLRRSRIRRRENRVARQKGYYQ